MAKRLNPPRFAMIFDGGERGPVIFPAFKAGDSALRGSNGGFDSHTLPPILDNAYAGSGETTAWSVRGGDSHRIALASLSSSLQENPERHTP
jgi:hypothetical protein